jgi:hypothetical protein
VNSEEQRYRSLVVDFCDIAVNGSKGRMREDPVAQAVTEGHGGSSCGFLLHCAAARIGIRSPWVNRDEISSYRDQQNISLLFGALWKATGPKCARRLSDGQLWKHGDFLVMGTPEIQDNDDHVFVAAKDFTGDVSASYDYGQRGAGGKPEDGRFVERDMQLRGGKWFHKNKAVWAMISVPEMIEEARETGHLVEPYEPSEWLRGIQ